MLFKNGIKKAWVHHRQLLARGRDEIGLFLSVIQISLLGGLFVKSLIQVSSKLVFLIVAGVFILLVLMQYFIGYLMDKSKIIENYIGWNASRNPLFKEILKILKDKN